MGNVFDDITGRSRPETADETDEEVAASSEPSVAYTSRAVRVAAQELLKFGLLEADRKPNLYRTVTTQHERIEQILEPLDLRLRIDDVRGLAFVTVAEEIPADANDTAEASTDEWSHPLVRRQRLTLEQSLLVAILRQMYLAYEQEAGVGAGGAVVSLEELGSSLELYTGSSGSDARDEKRLRNLLDALKTHGIVSEINEKNEVNIRPIITHLANPESLHALLEHFRQVANNDAGRGQDS